MFLEVGDLWPKTLKGNDEKSTIMKGWMRRMGTLLDAFYIYAVINLALFEVIPFLITCQNINSGLQEYIFPFQITGLWKVNSTTSYAVTYLWELTATVPSQICLYFPYDLLVVTMTSNVSILLRLLQVDLENSIKVHDDEGKLITGLNVSDPENFDRIVKIVKDHQKLLRSHRTSYLSALGFSNTTLRSFSKIMSSAWTYFSLLVQMYNEN